MRIAAIIEYDGSRFSGWQRQEQARSVQGVVEQALSAVANEAIQVIVAGRTDAGVHAVGQVIHFDTNATRSDYSWVHGANSNLPEEVALLWAGPVSDEFHARYSATGRHYHYIVLNRAARPTYLARRVTHDYRALDVARMREAATYLIGAHDFTSFRATECQAKNPVRDLRALKISRQGELVHVHAYANAFLQHMVRNLAGVLLTIGAGEREPVWAKEVLEARARAAGGVTAAAHGLYLREVEYPAHFNIPQLSHTVQLC
ncbi:MAG: tRNA pseudouridine(38-40) synthase TruA [Gammaproteobacteria bacterium]|nr:tRNA pseudouridine(38-40) synthase TruA [Gammaproteobacteria bacterium]